MTTQVRGHVAGGFERVADVLEDATEDLLGGGASFSAVVDGELVVDLRRGEARPGVPWSEDTLAILMSATKGVTTFVVQILVEEGMLDLDTPVAAYWPEFAQNGKDRVLVRHILSHTSGVVVLPGYDDLLHWDGQGWDANEEIARRLAAATPAWAPGTQHGYHAMTYGWLLGELVRRVTGATLGQNLRRRVAEPLGLDLWLGLPEAHHGRVAEVRKPPPVDVPEILALQQMVADPAGLPGQALVAMHGTNVMDEIETLMNGNATVLKAELGGSNGVATTAALARMYAVLAAAANGDESLVSAATVKAFSAEQAMGPDAVLVVPARWSLGYQLPVQLDGVHLYPFGPSEGVFGHHGFGGQFGFADPDRNVAVAMTRNHLSSLPLSGPQLIDALYECLT